VVIDATARLLPGVLGNESSAAFESFQQTATAKACWIARTGRARPISRLESARGSAQRNHEEIRRFRKESANRKDGEAAAGLDERGAGERRVTC